MFEGEKQFMKSFTPEAKPAPEQETVPEAKIEEKEELRREGEKIYDKEFVDKLDEVLGHEFKMKGKDGQEESVVLKNIIDKHLEGFSSPGFAALSTEEKAEKQREFVMDLGRGINKIPSDDPWSFYFKRIMETGKINCSGSSALLGMALERTKEQSGIKSVEQGFPYGHAINMITFGDGRLYFADARNGTFEDISDYTKIDNKDGLKVYKIKQPKDKIGDLIPWRNIPATGVKEGAIDMYLSNLQSAHQAAEGKFDKALKMGRSKKELKQAREGAKEVCQENNLSSPEELDRLTEVKRFFNEKINKYHRSEEFKKEIKRIEKLMK